MGCRSKHRTTESVLGCASSKNPYDCTKFFGSMWTCRAELNPQTPFIPSITHELNELCSSDPYSISRLMYSGVIVLLYISLTLLTFLIVYITFSKFIALILWWTSEWTKVIVSSLTLPPKCWIMQQQSFLMAYWWGYSVNYAIQSIYPIAS